MPSKKFKFFNKPRTQSGNDKTNEKASSGREAGSGKQIAISKFFASAPKRKADEKTKSDDVEIIIDEACDQRDKVIEKKISSPIKKKLKLGTETAVSGQKEEDVKKVSVDTTQLLARTRKKLNTFAAADDSEKADSTKSFDFNCLKRDNVIDIDDSFHRLCTADCSTSSSDQLREDSTDAVASTSDRLLSTTPCLTPTGVRHGFAQSNQDVKEEPSAGTKSTTSKLSKFSSRRSGSGISADSAVPRAGSTASSSSANGAGSSRDRSIAPSGAGSSVMGRMKYTPLEQQVVELKEKYEDTVLFVECGYKYRFFGRDAEIAAAVLKIFCHQDHNFMTASIPVHRLFVHVRRLVSAGYKVGVVKQVETAALKAAGSNKSAPFTRRLTALYTKSTLIGEDVETGSGDQGTGQGVSVGRATNYLLCVCDHVTDKGRQEQNTLGIVAIQLSTGDIVYDSFEDKDSRAELETRLAHLQPVEVLLSQQASPATEKLVTGIQTISLTSDDRMRIERLDQSVYDYNSAFRLVSEFYQEQPPKGSDQLQEVVHLPKPVICCLAALIIYLRDFNLEKILLELGNFSQFSTSSKYLQLNSCTVRNLELFNNSTDGSTRGSLFWALNHTVTRPGAQMLRSWMSQPLRDYDEIIARQSAIADILAGHFPDWQKVLTLMSRLPDLQKALTAVYHKKCGTADFYNMCTALQRVHDEFRIQKEALHGHVTSTLLREIIQQVPELLSDISEFSGALVEKAAKENDKTNLFTDESKFPSVVKCKHAIRETLQALHDHRREVRLKLMQPSLEYNSVNGTEFLVEVKNTSVSCVPKNWTKIGSTKAVSRFHTPFIVEQYKLLQQGRERLDLVCHEAWQQFLDQFVSQYQRYRKAVQLLATLDCLFCLATVARSQAYCRPEIVKDEVCLEIEGGRHPVIQELLGENQQYVPNDTHLSTTGHRVMIITGPNMGGKSSYIKQTAIIAIMAQMGSYVPAEATRLGILDAVYTRMGATDEIFRGRSTFMVELQEAADIMAKVTSRSLVILDELGRGTSTHDGTAIAHATLEFFITKPRCLTLFVTHYPLLAEFETTFPDIVGNYHMAFLVNEQQDSNVDKVTFLYQLVRGVADRSYGLNVASLASMPDMVVKVAARKSRELEDAILQKRGHMQLLLKLFVEEDPTRYRDLINLLPHSDEI